jgi:membrane protein implicated in regulation of membrane protease activity
MTDDKEDRFRSYILGGLLFAWISLTQHMFDNGVDVFHGLMATAVLVGMIILELFGGKSIAKAIGDSVLFLSLLVVSAWIDHALHSYWAGLAFLVLAGVAMWGVRRILGGNTSGSTTKPPRADE